VTAAAPPEDVRVVRRSASAAPTEDDGPLVVRERDRPFLRLVGEIAGLFVAVAVPLGLLYRPWGDRWRIPLAYRGDLFAYAASVRSSDWLGTVRPNGAIGAPNGFDMGDFPLGGDRLHFIAVRIIGLVVDDSLAAINLYFLLGFFLIALASLLVLRSLKVSYLPALVSSVLFAFLPYHFARGLGHFPLATYYAVPVMVLVIVRATAGPLDIDSLNPTRLRQQWRPWLVTAALCLLVATSNS
jgi:phosphoglycerol transferase